MRSIHIKRSELYASKGQVKLSPATKESHTPTNDELNETLAEIITKKYIGENESNSQDVIPEEYPSPEQATEKSI